MMTRTIFVAELKNSRCFPAFTGVEARSNVAFASLASRVRREGEGDGVRVRNVPRVSTNRRGERRGGVRRFVRGDRCRRALEARRDVAGRDPRQPVPSGAEKSVG